jgi:hypothetical protein
MKAILVKASPSLGLIEEGKTEVYFGISETPQKMQ